MTVGANYGDGQLLQLLGFHGGGRPHHQVLGVLVHGKGDHFPDGFPMYEIGEESGELEFCHNPFSMPNGGLEIIERAINHRLFCRRDGRGRDGLLRWWGGGSAARQQKHG